MHSHGHVLASFMLLLIVSTGLDAQQLAPSGGATPAAAAITPADYTIGPDDVLTIVLWGEKDMSGDVIVRPDGKITLPLINDLVAAGLTPDQLREQIATLARQFVQDARATVTVKTINSRRVFITGQVEKPGSYQITARTTVLQLIALAGGLKEFAKTNRIVVMRTEEGREKRMTFDYKEVVEGKNLHQNVEMKSGDTVVVP